jgi:hypothetical protein
MKLHVYLDQTGSVLATTPVAKIYPEIGSRSVGDQPVFGGAGHSLRYPVRVFEINRADLQIKSNQVSAADLHATLSRFLQDRPDLEPIFVAKRI